MNNQVSDSKVMTALRAALAQCPIATEALCIAYSGGIDSTVLLHALAELVMPPRQLRAVHVDHGLHDDSVEWVRFCETTCKRLGVPLIVHHAEIDPAAPGGPEARARDARYAAFRTELKPGEILLTAHHLQDQAETFLLQLMRGAGPAGLAAMAGWREADGLGVMRPLLTVSPTDIQAYATTRQLTWVDDPSNVEQNFDRNYLRQEIFPRLASRWPAAAEVISRSARLSAQAAAAVAGAAAQDLLPMLEGNRLDLTAFAGLQAERQAAVLRAAVSQLGLPLPSEQQLKLALRDLLTARPDAELQFTWPGAALRRYRDKAWLYDEQQNALINADHGNVTFWSYGEVVDLGPVSGQVSAVEVPSGGLALAHLESRLCVRFREGGERLRLAPGGPQRSLKNLFQESGVVPWMRSHIPLIYSGDALLAVGNLWANADYQAAPDEPGVTVKWRSYATFK